MYSQFYAGLLVRTSTGHVNIDKEAAALKKRFDNYLAKLHLFEFMLIHSKFGVEILTLAPLGCFPPPGLRMSQFGSRQREAALGGTTESVEVVTVTETTWEVLAEAESGRLLLALGNERSWLATVIEKAPSFICIQRRCKGKSLHLR